MSSLPSLKRRFVWKLGGAASTAVAGLVAALLAPKALGPARYGDFSFCFSIFQRWVGFINLGAASAYFTRLSQRPEDHRLPAFYWRFFGLVATLTLGLVPLVFWLGWEPSLFPDQLLEMVLLAALLAVSLQALTVVQSMIDAHGLTVGGERARMVQKLVAAVALVVIYASGLLNLKSFFLYHLATVALGLVLSWWVLRRGAAVLFPRASLSKADYRELGGDFATYCTPLAVASTATALAAIGERWMLQAVGGSEQQGYFAVSAQVAALCFLMTEALRPLLFREFARLDLEGSVERAREVYCKAAPALYVLACYLGCFAAVYAEAVGWILDARFSAATLAVSVMALYPLHQTYGQLSSALLLAQARTRVYARISLMQAFLAPLLTAYLVAPRAWGGRELGALGLALATLAIQFLGVNLLIRDNARQLEISYPRLLLHQLLCPALFLGLATLVKGWLPHLLAGGLAYTVLSLLLLRWLIQPRFIHPDRSH